MAVRTIKRIDVIVPCFNPGAALFELIDALRTQSLKPGVIMRIRLVDDGSDPAVASRLPARLLSEVQIMRLAVNRGRAEARNFGAASSSADLLVLLDSDCVIDRCDFLEAHTRTIESGYDVSIGPVVLAGHDRSFWSRFQAHIHAKRHRALSDGAIDRGTSQNLAIRGECFRALEGFDRGFQRYGFEDLDFLLRVQKSDYRGRYTQEAAVRHDDCIALRDVSRKFLDMGRHTAPRFKSKHPVHYRGMLYFKLDAGEHRILRGVDRLAWPLARAAVRPLERLLNVESLPLYARIAFARAVYGLHFMHGTRCAFEEAGRENHSTRT